ncbi:Zn-ribbon domain-containing OB-fold protein [Brevundimonas vitis]|uniref:Zn-ribbon domain-containing OB-fold protein n=1 Tax=Brevundimonas vitisensis TaxID=2800818 RepID=A0ABX7BL07_9CAUL|nr:Zn-ribbon domain-containing OB-fold protein [Brevundimonas vitisensis]QQQ17916.1 Zn-ribbon domain-containing OB-fold protein [Brevundimonas vitisensis]
MSQTAFDFPVTDLSRPYWEAASQGRLTAPKCDDCGRFFFAPEIACTHCFSLNWTWSPVAGQGEVYSYTTIHRAPQPGMAAPYVLAAIDLPEGFAMFAHLVDCPPEALACGLPVQVDFRPLHDGRIAPVFKPR